MARCPLIRRNLDSTRSNPAVHQRFRMSPSRQRVTRAVTRRVTLRADSIGLVVARVRRSAELGWKSRFPLSSKASVAQINPDSYRIKIVFSYRWYPCYPWLKCFFLRTP